MESHERSLDRWLKYAVIIGPLITYVLGIGTGVWGAYQAYKDDSHRITLVEGWKEKQEDFNKETIRAISTLQEVVRHIKP